MTSTQKHIVKMIIKGHAQNKDSNITCETFNKEVFAKLLSHFPFDNKILLVQNLTCYGVSSLRQNEKLECTFAADTIAQNARSRYETIMKNKNNDIISMGVEAAKLSNFLFLCSFIFLCNNTQSHFQPYPQLQRYYGRQ